MKILSILLVAAFAAYFTPLEANNQQKSTFTAQPEKKIYVNPENLHLSKEGFYFSHSWPTKDLLSSSDPTLAPA